MRTLLISLLLVAGVSAAAEEQRVYVLGSSINLRKEPSKDAESLQMLPIGTECLVSEKPSAEWLKVRCGEKEGYASASLLGPEKPSLEKLKAEAQNPKLKLEQRQDSALRAASLSPEDPALQKQLGTLFFERNLQLAAAAKKSAQKRTFSCSCGFKEDALACLTSCSGSDVRNVKVRVETKKNWFVAALSNGENVAVYRGTYRYTNNNKSHSVAGEAYEWTSFASTPVMEKALFSGARTTPDDDRLAPFGKYILDENSQALLGAIPKTWGQLIRGPGDIMYMYWKDCAKKPFQLQFIPDMQGRWILSLETQKLGPLGYRISAVSKQGNELQLTLERGDRNVTVTHEVFKLPAPDDDQASLSVGDTFWSYNAQRYPEQHLPCREGGP